MEEQIKKEIWLLKWIQNDFWYILICLFALFACMWTIYGSMEYQNQINDFWYEQIEECVCPWDSPEPANISYQFIPFFYGNEEVNEDGG